jgi:hypothetical protein
MGIHMGRILSLIMKDKARGDIWLGAQIHKARGTILDMRKRPHISSDLLLAASIALEVDLFRYLSQELERQTGKLPPIAMDKHMVPPVVQRVMVTITDGEVKAKLMGPEPGPRDKSGTKQTKKAPPNAL